MYIFKMNNRAMNGELLCVFKDLTMIAKVALDMDIYAEAVSLMQEAPVFLDEMQRRMKSLKIWKREEGKKGASWIIQTLENGDMFHEDNIKMKTSHPTRELHIKWPTIFIVIRKSVTPHHKRKHTWLVIQLSEEENVKNAAPLSINQ